jgi:hypothetical protein
VQDFAMASSISSNRLRFVICTAVCVLLALSGGAVAQQQSISPGCQALQNAQPFALAHGGGTTGKYPDQTGRYFYQGDTVGATWPSGVQMTFAVWQIGTQDQILRSLSNNRGTASLTLGIPNNYFAVQLTNNDPSVDVSGIQWTCIPKPAPIINQTHNFNATVSVTFLDTLTNDTGQLSGVMFIDENGDLVSAALTLTLPYSGQDGIYSTSSCDFQSGSNDSTRTLFILDSGNCLYYNLAQSNFGVRVYIQSSQPLTSPGSATLTAASYVSNFGVGGAQTGGDNTIAVTSSLTDMHNFNGDNNSDILWSAPVSSPSVKQAAPQSASTTLAIWLMNGAQTLSTGVIANVPTNWSIIGQRDFTGNGNTDLLWRDNSGNLAMWFMNGLQISSTASLGNVPSNWSIYGTGDLNGDGIGDLLWRDSSSGAVAVWFMAARGISSTASYGVLPSNWTIIGDDNKGDIFLRDSAGDIAIWQVRGPQITHAAVLANVTSNWVVLGFGDFNGDGNTDLLFRDTNSGTVAIWFLNSSGGIQSTASVGSVPTGTTWQIALTGDYNGDGYSDMLLTDGSGNVAIWFMNGATIASTAGLGNVGTSWTVHSANAE